MSSEVPIGVAVQVTEQESMDVETDKSVVRPDSLSAHLYQQPTASVQASDVSMNNQHQMIVTPTQAAGTLGLTADQYKHLTVYNNKLSRYDSDFVKFYRLGRPIGCALMIGCSTCPRTGFDRLYGTHIDLKLMNESLSQCGFHVLDPFSGPNNYSTQESCKKYLQNLEAELVSHTCFLFYYSGHGNAKGMLLSDGNVWSYADVIETVYKLSSMRGKPKIFIFDSCRKKSDSKTIFSKQIKRPELYSDTLVCFSASDGAASFSVDNIGSFYTEQLAKMLMSFGKKLTITEIVQLAHGWMKETAAYYKKEQQPIMLCTLEKLLVFNADGVRMDKDFVRFPNKHGTGHENSQFVYVKGKGGPCAAGESLTQGVEVESDAAGKGRLKFKTKEDVTSNLPKLGKGVSVFICYLPNPTDPYSDREQQEVISNLIKIKHLIRDLERFGFTVISDLLLNDSQPSNWLQWYVSRMELCDFLIMVGSPAFKDVFTSDGPSLPLCDERVSWFFTYRNAMYGDIHKEVNQKPQGSKFIAVLLDDRWAVENCIPTLFLAGSTYQLGPEGNRSFEYDNRERDFERMICCMSGINRMEIDKLEAQMPVKIPRTTYTPAPGMIGAEPFVRKPRRGEKVVQWQPRGPLAQQPQYNPGGHPAQQPQYNLGGHPAQQPQYNLGGPPAQQPQYNPGGHPAQPLQYNLGGHPAQQPQYNPGGHPAQPQYNPGGHPAQQPQYNLGGHPAQAQDTRRPPELHPPESLPDKSPSQEIIFWLVQNITNWRFVARYLGLEDSEIERISVNNRDDVVEQRFKMFDSWQRHSTSPYTYQTLGVVLLKSSDNIHLYMELLNKLYKEESR